MIESVKRFLTSRLHGSENENAEQALSAFDQCFLMMPVRNQNFKEGTSKYREAWKQWILIFSPLFVKLNKAEEQSFYSNLSKMPYLRVFHFLEALVLEKAEIGEQVFDGLAHFYDELIHSESYDSTAILFLSNLKISLLPQRVIAKFPQSDSKSDLIFKDIDSETIFNANLEIILVRILDQELTEANINTLVFILERFKKAKMALPRDSEFTLRVLHKYHDSIRVRRAIKALHNAHPKWASNQSHEPKEKKKK